MTEHDWRLSVMPEHESVAQVVTVWKACEDAGMDVVGPADSQYLLREMYVRLTVAAMSTSKIKLMSYATNGQGNEVVIKDDDEAIALINKFGHKLRPKLN